MQPAKVLPVFVTILSELFFLEAGLLNNRIDAINREHAEQREHERAEHERRVVQLVSHDPLAAFEQCGGTFERRGLHTIPSRSRKENIPVRI